MLFFRKIRNAITALTGLIQYHYSSMRNYYPCKVIGEKRSEKSKKTTIIYQLSGRNNPTETLIENLLANPSLIACFHPKEAFRMGSIALEDFISEFPVDERIKKYNHVKNAVLNYTHNTGCINHTEDLMNSNITFGSKMNDATISKYGTTLPKNKYPYRMVHGKQGTTDTTIIFTIFGKREGYELALRKIIKNDKLLEKFHPTEALKFGFISLGDILFSQKKEKNIA